MKKIKYDCVENENYITFVMDGETLEEVEIGTHGAPSQGRTIIGAKDLKNALELIDYQDVEKSATSEEVQIEINRLQESLNQTKEAAKELKEQKYTVNMLPVYNQIKSLELQITALQAYHPDPPKGE